MTSRDKIILLSLLDTIDEIQEYCRRESCYIKEEFMNNSLLKRAVSMCMISISENIAKLSDDFREDNDHINVKLFKVIRNIAAHNYGAVNFSKIWDAISIDIPALERQINKILKDYGYRF